MLSLPRVIGHRGACGHAPENTLAAMRMAKALGASWVEFDVMMCASGELVLRHDDLLRRTTNGFGRVSKLNFSELSKLDAGSWFAPEFSAERIPLFVDVIKLLAELGLGANVEIKPAKGAEQATAQKVVSTLHEHWPSELPAPLLSSFSLEAARAVRSASPDAQLGLLLDRWKRNWESLADELGAVSVHLYHRKLTAARVERIKSSGRLVLAYTVNSESRAQTLFDWGVDSVFSDFPEKFFQE